MRRSKRKIDWSIVLNIIITLLMLAITLAIILNIESCTRAKIERNNDDMSFIRDNATKFLKDRLNYSDYSIMKCDIYDHIFTRPYCTAMVAEKTGGPLSKEVTIYCKRIDGKRILYMQ